MLLSTNKPSKQHAGTSTSLLFMLIKLGEFCTTSWLILGICGNANEAAFRFIWGWVIFDMQTHFVPISITTVTFLLGKAVGLWIPLDSSLHRGYVFQCSRSLWYLNCVQIAHCRDYLSNASVSLATSEICLIFYILKPVLIWSWIPVKLRVCACFIPREQSLNRGSAFRVFSFIWVSWLYVTHDFISRLTWLLIWIPMVTSGNGAWRCHTG